ncbi:MAG TPA: hypothetical protein GX708_05165 [Gallicola sp.]|nr:hypothetical protein [Gallicola sp.]
MKKNFVKIIRSIQAILNDNSGKLLRGTPAIGLLVLLGLFAIFDLANGSTHVLTKIFLPTLGISVILTIGAYIFNEYF